MVGQNNNGLVEYKLEKSIWTQDDFDKMGWHDCKIHKMRLSNDFELDIDYILKWNQPDIKGLMFTFWVVPATLVFKNIRSLKFELDMSDYIYDDLIIEDIERECKEGKIRWYVMTRDGEFEFDAHEYIQYMRQKPSFQFGQTISFKERGGDSYERTINQENPNREHKDVIEGRAKDFEDYENLKKRQLKILERVELEEQFKNKKIELKEYLLKKKEIKEMIDFYNAWLRGTSFEGYGKL